VVLADRQIKRLGKKAIDPFVPHTVRNGAVSYGLSSAGYDLRLADEFLLPTGLPGSTLDPKDHAAAKKLFRQVRTAKLVLGPGQFVLARTIETVRMPPDVLGIVVGKSTYARCGILVNTTPIEPGWEGVITLEISNLSRFGVTLYPGEGIAQLVLFKLGAKPLRHYGQRGGAYQGQTTVTLPAVVPARKTEGNGTARRR
jgi:dCTP deaminase